MRSGPRDNRRVRLQPTLLKATRVPRRVIERLLAILAIDPGNSGGPDLANSRSLFKKYGEIVENTILWGNCWIFLATALQHLISAPWPTRLVATFWAVCQIVFRLSGVENTPKLITAGMYFCGVSSAPIAYSTPNLVAVALGECKKQRQHCRRLAARELLKLHL